MRRVLIVALLALASACAPLTRPGDQPEASRMGRFLGLVARCGCTDVSAERMIAEYPKVLVGKYDDASVKRMRGYVVAATGEHFINQDTICKVTCNQKCAVENVSRALGTRSTGVAACPMTEGGLDMPDGDWMSTGT